MSESEVEMQSAPVRASRKGVWGWMFFDWAAQPFFTVMTTFIFGPYVVSRMVEDPVVGQTAWASTIAVAGLFIAILSPVLGSIADKTGPRKPWIAFFAVIKITCLLLLWYAVPGSSLIWVLALFILATVAAEFSIVFNDSMMSSVIPSKEIGRASNIAWGLGYLGGMIVLIIVLLFMAENPATGLTLIGIQPIFGLDFESGADARVAGPLSALWYLVFIIPMFVFTPDAMDRSAKLMDSIRNGIVELKDTILEAHERRGLFRFLVARMIYQDGVTALLALGGVFAANMFDWSTMELGIFGIILNVVAIPSCFAAARLDTKFGSKTIVSVSIVLLIVATIGVISTGPGFTLFGLVGFEQLQAEGLFGTAAEKAYILYCLLIGIAFGPVQASSRAYLARSVSREETGRFFGLYAFAGRATSFLAPASVAAVTAATGSERFGMAVIIIFFVVGLAILVKTPYPAKATV